MNYEKSRCRHGMDDELHLVRCRLRYIRDIAEDFRENTSLGTIIRDYESRYKELLKIFGE